MQRKHTLLYIQRLQKLTGLCCLEAAAGGQGNTGKV